MKNHSAWSFLLVVLVPFLLIGCGDTDEIQKVAQEQIQAEANRQAGLPVITNFTEKKLVKKIYESRDQSDLATWTYIVDINGKKHLLFRSIGFGVPYATQYSNPQKATVHSYSLPQAEPNGLFLPSSAKGMWLLMATKNGPQAVFCQYDVIVSPVELTDDEVVDNSSLHPAK